MLGAIIARLLAKDPDPRYQSAEGVLHDLRRLRADPGATFATAERDFPWELSAPSRIIGRATEIEVLGRALVSAVAGSGAAVLVGGPSGAGKSALIDQLHPLVTRSAGWFVAGKFDQLRGGPEHPLVMVVDDLQWAFPTAVDFVDNVIAAGELPATHPLAAALARWPGRGPTRPRHRQHRRRHRPRPRPRRPPQICRRPPLRGRTRGPRPGRGRPQHLVVWIG